jgi:DNA-binding transcriptional ArsR family regulator
VGDAGTQTDDGRRRLDPRLPKAVGHPLRVEILERLHGRVASPKELSHEMGRSLSHVDHHLGVLMAVDAISLVKTEARRGATEHFYVTEPRALIGHQDWRLAPPAVLPAVTSAALGTFGDQIGRAIEAGTIEGRKDTTLNWMPLTLDQRGWREAVALMRQALEFMTQIHDRSVERLGDKVDDAIPVIAGLAAFEAAPPEPVADAPGG